MGVCSTSILLLLLGICVMVCRVMSCPPGCSCSNSGNQVTADCSGRGLTAIPTLSVDANTKILKMARNQLTRVRSGFLTSYPDLEELYLEDNRIEVLEASAFSGFKLKKLKLNGNRIREITGDAIKGIQGQCDPEGFKFIRESNVKFGRWPVPNLNEVGEWPCTIDLRDNPLTMVRTNAFRSSEKYTLYLGESHVGMTIESGAFAESNNILGVHIVRVPTLTLTTGTFMGMGNVGWIVIDRTVVSLTGRLFAGANSHPRWFRISNSNIPALNANSLTMLMDVKQNCDVKTYTYGPARVLYSSINTLERGGIEILYNTLPVLPAQLIRYSHIGGMLFLGNTIAGFEPGVFEREANQASICLIRFDDNQLDTIPTHIFKNLRNTVRLFVTGSRLRTIEADAFDGTENIGRLDIRFTKNGNLDRVTIKANALRNAKTKVLSITQEAPTTTVAVIEPFAFADIELEYMTLSLDKGEQVLQENLFSGLTVNQRFSFYAKHIITRVHANAFGCPGKGTFNHVEVHADVRLSCDCETRRLNAILREKVNTIEGLGCTNETMSYTLPSDDLPLCDNVTLCDNVDDNVDDNDDDDDDDDDGSPVANANGLTLNLPLVAVLVAFYCLNRYAEA